MKRTAEKMRRKQKAKGSRQAPEPRWALWGAKSQPRSRLGWLGDQGKRGCDNHGELQSKHYKTFSAINVLLPERTGWPFRAARADTRFSMA